MELLTRIQEKQVWFLYLLIAVGVILRIWQFGTNPISLNRDEVALGYNAFAIAEEGIDEWGERYPVVFESFGDYKLPGYIYITSIFFSLFPSSDVLVRLPSLLAGLGVLYLSYLIGRQVYDSKKAGLAVSALIAISPWAIFYSRMAWEANVALMWLLACVYLIIRKHATWNYIGVAISYFLAVFTYNTPLLLAPVLILFVLLQFQKSLTNRLIYVLMVLGISLLAATVLLPVLGQKSAITIFSDPTIASLQRDRYVSAETNFEKVLEHRYTNWSRILLQHGLESVSPIFLVLDGGSHPWHSLPGRGHQYLTVWLLFMAGLGLMLYQTFRKNIGWISWLILVLGSLAPAVTTVDAPHATRSLLFFWLIGFVSVMTLIRFPKIVWVVGIGLVVELILFVHGYFYLYPKADFSSWQAGLKEAIESVEKRGGDQSIVITQHPDSVSNLLADQVYIYALFYSKTPPTRYQQTRSENPRDVVNLVRITQAGNYVIVNEPWIEDDQGILIQRQPSGEYEVK